MGSSSTCRYPFQPTSTAARPTNECSRAISSGIPVISTTAARRNPIPAPITIAMIINAIEVPVISPDTACAIVAISATTIPAMPK